jgi:hypothetical protein
MDAPRTWIGRCAAALAAAGYGAALRSRVVGPVLVDLVLPYAARELDRKAVVLLYVDHCHDRYLAAARRVARANTPAVAVWVYDARAGTLDPADGSTLTVE